MCACRGGGGGVCDGVDVCLSRGGGVDGVDVCLSRGGGVDGVDVCVSRGDGVDMFLSGGSPSRRRSRCIWRVG